MCWPEERPNLANRVPSVAEHGPRLMEEDFACWREPNFLRTAFKEHNPELILKVADLSAERRLRHIQARRRSGDVEFLGDGHEVAKMASFHAFATIPKRYGEPSDMIFFKRRTCLYVR